MEDSKDDILSSLLGTPEPTEEAPPEEALLANEESSLEADPIASPEPDLSFEAAEPGEQSDPGTAFADSEATSHIQNELTDAVIATEAGFSTPIPTEYEANEGAHFYTIIIRNFLAKKEEVAAVIKDLELSPARPEELNLGEAMLLSRLDEYRAIRLAQEFWRLGLNPEWQTRELNPTESIGETKISQGAPSVALLEGTQEVWLSTLQSLPGFQIEGILGLVSAHRSIPRRFFREDSALNALQSDLKKIKDRERPESHYEELLHDLSRELQERALGQGANAVLGIEMEFFPELHGSERSQDELRVVVIGTAIRLTRSLEMPLNSL